MGIQERKEREKEARRDEILDAAYKVFIARGLTGSTVDDIAAEAELSKGTIYLYFRSKEDLYLAVTNRGLAIMHSMFEQAVSGEPDPYKAIWALSEAYISFFEQHRDYFRMLSFFENTEMHDMVSGEMMAECQAHDAKVWGFVSGVMKNAIEAGYLHAGLNPLEVGMMLWSNATGLMRQLDRNEEYWYGRMGIDLRKTLRTSSGFLLEAMMTEKAMQMYPDHLIHHGPERSQEKKA
jgi:TetR/AcrR family transcriptional regulator